MESSPADLTAIQFDPAQDHTLNEICDQTHLNLTQIPQNPNDLSVISSHLVLLKKHQFHQRRARSKDTDTSTISTPFAFVGRNLNRSVISQLPQESSAYEHSRLVREQAKLEKQARILRAKVAKVKEKADDAQGLGQADEALLDKQLHCAEFVLAGLQQEAVKMQAFKARIEKARQEPELRALVK
jgi:hypothetical protein